MSENQFNLKKKIEIDSELPKEIADAILEICQWKNGYGSVLIKTEGGKVTELELRKHHRFSKN